MASTLRMLSRALAFTFIHYCFIAPGNAQTSISCGDRMESEISSAGERDLYVFSAVAGEAVQLVGETLTPGLQAEYVVYDPFGNQVGIKSIAETRSNSIQVPFDGDYEIEVRDFFNQNTGSYTISLHFTTGRCAVPVACGSTAVDGVSLRGEQRSFRFSAVSGEAVRAVTALRSRPGQFPAVEVFDPTGARIGSGLQGDTGSIPLTTDGDYTIVVSGFFSFFEQPQPDTFALSLQFSTGRCAVSISPGASYEQQIAHFLRQDSFSFQGVQGGWVHVDSEALDYLDWSPEVRLFDQLGSEVGMEQGPAVDFFLPRNSHYTALITASQQGGRRYRARVNPPGPSQFPLFEGLFRSPLGASAVAYNSLAHEYLVVFPLDVSAFDEYEIYGQRVDAATFALLGDSIRISQTGPELDARFDALEPAVAYNSVSNEYLVVWSADRTVDGHFEILGQRLNGSTGAATGNNDFLVGASGDGGPSAACLGPKLIHNPVTNQYLVAWYSDSLQDEVFDVFSQRLSANGDNLGGAQRLSTSISSGPGARYLDLAHATAQGEYLVVWSGAVAAGGAAVYGKRLNDVNASPFQNNEFLISAASGDSSPEHDTPGPSVTCLTARGQYLVAWPGRDGGIHGRRLTAGTGLPLEPVAFPISLWGTGRLPRVAANGSADEYLVIWERDSGGGEYEIAGQRIGAELGLKTGELGFRISETGPEGSSEYGAHRPDLLFNPVEEHYLAVWDANSRPIGGNQAVGSAVMGTAPTAAGTTRWIITRRESDADSVPFSGTPALTADGSLLVTGGYGALTRLTTDGDSTWTVSEAGFGSEPVGFPAVRADGTVILGGFLGDTGHLNAYSPDGSPVWSSTFQGAQLASLALDSQDRIYGVTADGSVSAFAADGTPRWDFSPAVSDSATAPVLTFDDRILFGTADTDAGTSRVWALNSEGDALWSVALDWIIPAGHALALGSDETLYVGGSFLGAISSDGTLQWQVPATGESSPGTCRPMVGPQDTIVCPSGNALLTFGRDGERQALFFGDSSGELFSEYTAVASDGTVYAASTLAGQPGPGASIAKIYAVGPRGDLRWKAIVPGSDLTQAIPTLGASGNLYLISTSGTLYSVRTSSAGAAPAGWAMVGHEPQHSGRANQKESHRLYFAQFADGAEALSSRIVLFNPSSSETATGRILLRDDDGQPLTVDLNGNVVAGEQELAIPPSGMLVLETDSLGELVVGSAVVESDQRLGGVILFGGIVGLAGVGDSAERTEGFLAPMQTDSEAGINTGIAIVNLESVDQEIDLTLFSSAGQILATARLEGVNVLKAHGHRARFVNDFPWDDPQVDFSSFQGMIKAAASGRISATVIQTRPSQFATMPVSASARRSWGKLLLRAAQLTQTAVPDGAYSLYFAQFADGRGALSSQILLFNPDDSVEVAAEITLSDDDGNPLTVDLNGETVNGSLQVTVPASSVRVLETDSLGNLVVGSAVVQSDRPLAGVIVFSGQAVGLAGVGSSPEIRSGFLAPMQTQSQAGINTGIALMNLEDSETQVDFQLCTEDGQVLSTAVTVLPPKGHSAVFVNELDWLNSNLDLSDFNGLLKVTAGGPISATVIQTRPGQFATMPVLPYSPGATGSP